MAYPPDPTETRGTLDADPYIAEITEALARCIDDKQRRQTEQEAGMFWIEVDDSTLLIVRRPSGDRYPSIYRVKVEPVRFEVA